VSEILKPLALAGDVWVLWTLIAASVLSFGVIMERWWVFRKNRLDFPRFLDDWARRVEKKDVAGARQVSQQAMGLEARVAVAGLEHFSKGPASVEEAMTSRLVLERAALEKHLIILGSLGNNAPFVGLFGTVLGIITAFNDLAISGQSGVSAVMAGISSALVATALGIFVAVPAVLANNAFHTRLKRLTTNAQSLIHMAQVYLCDETLGRARRGGPDAKNEGTETEPVVMEMSV
jgi:biopolymer transport protein ExbB